jgi:repressor LexA
MNELTLRQREVLTFLEDFLDDRGYPPSIREIAERLRVSGTLGVTKHLDALERKGYLRREPGSSRGIRLTGRREGGTVDLPIVGTVRAGLPAEALEEIEGHYPIEKSRLHGGAFFLRVRGDSMTGAGILEGDLALVRPQSTAENRDVVVALVRGEATLKTFYRERGGIRLQPENPALDPIFVSEGEDISIVGKVVRIIREME